MKQAPEILRVKTFLVERYRCCIIAWSKRRLSMATDDLPDDLFGPSNLEYQQTTAFSTIKPPSELNALEGFPGVDTLAFCGGLSHYLEHLNCFADA